MCEPVDSRDSRGVGWHCCGPNGRACNAFNGPDRVTCWACGRRSHVERGEQLELAGVAE